MRKIYSLLFILALVGSVTTKAQITVTGGTGLAASYGSLTKAGGLFEAINLTAQTGNNILVTITGDVTTEDGITNLAAGAWASITIKPSGAKTISGAAAAGSALISFSGADNVTIDGLNTGGNSLTISNTLASATAGTSTIKFVSDASNNTITNCSILGSCTMAAASNGGNVYFGLGTTTGNDNNTISNCNIGPAGANLPTKGVFGNGSGASTAVGNSGNVITNNNIYDIFGAAVTSAGIYINNGCNTWSITNNRIYQTASRTWTTGALHNGINIQSSTATSGAQGFTITGNIIGYASSAQTGTYTLTGSTGKFGGILFNGIIGGTLSNINNNTIASVSVTGVTSSGNTTISPFSGIIISNGVVISSNNTIGSQTATGSLVFSTTTTTSFDVFGILNFGTNAWTSNSNNIGGIRVTNLGLSGTILLYAMRASGATSVTWTANDNLVGGTVANSIQLTSTGAASQLAGMLSSNSAMAFSNNTIRNLYHNNGNGIGVNASVIGIVSSSTVPTHTLSRNTIYNLSNTNTTAASTVTGIQFTGGSGNIAERNFIYGLTAATSSATAEVTGIRIAGGTSTFRNNMIALGAGITNAVQVNGINEPVLGTDNFYHNSIYIGGSPTAGAGNSFAFNSTQENLSRSYRNNIFVNTRTNSGSASGKNYAIQVGGAAANPTGLTINNNLYFVTGTGTVFGRFNTADVADLAAWKTAVGQDANSFQSDPKFNNPTAAVPDLHIHPTNITNAESTGADVGITDDFDGQVRSGLSPVDIGADAGNFGGLDVSGPTITYTPLNNTCTVTGVTLTATVTDISGVPTTGSGRPVLYWKVNSGSYTGVTGTFVSGNTYSFTFGSGAVGNTISYYIVAQDMAATPNVACSPATGAAGFTNTPPAASNAPSTPSTFTLQNSMGGTYTVGATGNFTSITAAVAAYNTSCLTSAVVFSLTDAAYAEVAAITINANSFASATNTLTIKPTQANTTITVSGGSSSAIFVLNGADYVTIDGSAGNTANTVCPLSAATRNLTISNSNASVTSAVVWLQTTAGSDAATNNTVKNCNLVGSGVAQTLFGLGSGSASISISSLGTGNNNNSFINNNISAVQYGIYSQGAGAANKNSNTTINQNIITASPNTTGGILVGFENNITISGNSVSNIAQSTKDIFGIAVGMSALSATTFAGNEVTNATVTSNAIGSVTGSGTFSAAGIALAAAASGTTLIANNTISGVSSNGTSGDFAAGIILGGGVGSSINVYHNTVAMQGAITGAAAATTTSACLAVTASAASAIDVRNNIFSNTQTGNTGATVRFAAIALGYSTYTSLTSNNNNLYAAGAGPGTYITGITGTVVAGTNSVTLTNWQTTTGKDGNSKSVLPVYVSSTNLHLDNANVSNGINFDGTGASGTGVNNDMDCETRNGSTPDMGADEFISPNCTGATGGTASGNATYCGSGTPAITATGFSSGNSTTYQWYTSIAIGDYPNGGAAVSGQTNPAALTTGVVNTTSYYWLKVTCTAASVSANSSMVTVTVNPIPGAVTVSGAGTYCANATITAANGGAGTIYFQGIISGGTNTSFPSTSQNITASNTYYFRAQSAAGCWGQEGSAVVTINSNYSITASAGSNGTISPAGATSVTCSGTGSQVYTITPAACYQVADVLVDGVSVGAVTSYTFSNVTANHTISASFVLGTYTITVTPGADGSITPGTGTVNCGANATYTIAANSGYSISNVVVDGVSQGAISSYTFTNVQAAHSISATFVINCVNVGISSATAGNSGPLCTGETTTLTANGVTGTNALVTWYTGTGATGTNLGTGLTLSNTGSGKYYAYVTGTCGAPVETSVTVTGKVNIFSGTGNWTDNARWSCGVPPVTGDAITLAANANATLNINFTVGGSFAMGTGSKLIVSPTSSLTISGTANFAGQSVTFKSDITGTSSLGQVTGTLTGATNVTVERYIPKNLNKAWRLLATNTSGQTIKQSWQENQTGFNVNNTPGYGTMITNTGTNLATAMSNGFDTLSVARSIFKYNPVTDNFDPITNTNTTQLSSQPGYFIFIRGDRSPNQFGAGAAETSTVLRSTGSLFVGNQPAVNIPAGQYALVRNPYPSRLDMRQIAITGGVVAAFQVWDPKYSGENGVGGYQTFTKVLPSGDFLVSPGGGSYGTNGSVQNYIESGAAFFAQATLSAGTVQVLESSKASGSQDVFRPAATDSRLLFSVYANNVGSTDLVDGGFIDFNDIFSNTVDRFDVRKSTNFSENFGVLRNNTELVVERRKAVTVKDTIFFKMYQLKTITYRLDIKANGFDPQTTKAILEDKFTGTFTPLDLSSATTSYSFAVNGIAGSSASGRFRILFSPVANVFSGNGNWTDNARWSLGTPALSGDDITIAAGANAILNTDFTIGGSLTMQAASTLTIEPTKTLTISGTADFAGQLVTFKSDNTGTASLGQVTGTLNNATNVTVERYIPNNGFRSWRLLSVPTIGNGQTIKQAWQEGNAPMANSQPGFGTQITGVGNLAAAQAAGFDNVAASASMLQWNGTAWSGISNTNAAIANNTAYFLYVRGERSKGVSGSSTDASATTLRTNGTVYTGDQVNTIGANAYGLVPNLYPSAINFTGLTRTAGINNLFYIWDSKKISGSNLGVYQTFSSTNSFNCMIAGGSYTLGQPNTTIESGQAFFVKSTLAGTLTLKESAKISGTSGNQGFRPSANPAKIDSRLYSGTDMIDANVVVFDEVYDRAVDADDAPKMGNPGANFAVETDSKLLAIEGTQPPAHNDKIQFRMWNLRRQAYTIAFTVSNVNTPGLTAVLEDTYLHTSTPLNLGSTSTVDFTVDANAASSDANRFRIVFQQSAPLPVSFISINGNRTSSGIKVDWKVAAETNIRSYEIERSNNGNNFGSAGSVTVTGNTNGNTADYSFMDAAAPATAVFYRIKSVGTAGDSKYSTVVKIAAGNVKAGYAILPNFVENGIVNVQFNNQPEGKYAIRVMSITGQAIMTASISHTGGNGNQLVELPSTILSGAYKVEIVAPDNTRAVQSLFVNKK